MPFANRAGPAGLRSQKGRGRSALPLLTSLQPVGAPPNPFPRAFPERATPMSGQRGSERRQLTEMIGIRVTPEELLRVAREAEVAGLTIAALTRRRLLGLRIAARVDDEQIRDLRRLGGLAKLAMLKPGLREEARLLLRAIRRAIDLLSGSPP